MMKKLLSLASIALAGALVANAASFTEVGRQFAPSTAPLRISNATSSAVQSPLSLAKRAAAKKAPASASELLGEYINQSVTYFTDPVYEGGSVTITQGTGDTIVLNNFWNDGTAVKAVYNASTGTLSIPSQQVYNLQNYGACDLSSFTLGTNDITVTRNTPISAKVYDGGIIVFGDYGVFVNSGSYKDAYLDVVEQTILAPANGKMDVTYEQTTQSKKSPESWNVLLEEENDTVWVYNFGNFGMTAPVVLAADGKATVPQTMVLDQDTVNGGGDYYTYAADWASGSVTALNIAATWTPSLISWDNWVIYSEMGYYTGPLKDAKIYYTDNTKFYLGKDTGVNDVNADKQAVGKVYYNLAGQRSVQPFEGLNVVVTTYSDGTTSAAKVLK